MGIRIKDVGWSLMRMNGLCFEKGKVGRGWDLIVTWSRIKIDFQEPVLFFNMTTNTNSKHDVYP